MSSSHRRFIVGITGASGAAYALRLIEQLLTRDHAVHLVVSDYGKRLLYEEAGIRKIEPAQLVPDLADSPAADRLIIHPNADVGATIASGSSLFDGMAILPCTSSTMGAIASGSGSNLLTRAAMVTLKERRPLIVCHRETPLSLIDIESMRTLTLAGATICPTNPGLYLDPQTIADLIDFIVAKVLDLLKVEHDLCTRWEDHTSASTRSPSDQVSPSSTGAIQP